MPEGGGLTVTSQTRTLEYQRVWNWPKVPDLSHFRFLGHVTCCVAAGEDLGNQIQAVPFQRRVTEGIQLR